MKPNDLREPKRDCFAYKNDKTCNALTEMMCTYKNCPFYKNRNDVDMRDIMRG